MDGGVGGKGTITTWNDLNPQTSLPNNPNQNGAATLKPQYTPKAINGLPALKFDRSTDYLNFNGTSIANSDYSVVIVEGRLDNRGNNNTQYYYGYISEVIIFNKYIKDSERQNIERYLGQKWGIKVP
jgi:hypothetical protein